MSAIVDAIDRFLTAVTTRILGLPSNQVLLTPELGSPGLVFAEGAPYREMNVATTTGEYNTFHGLASGSFLDARSDLVYYNHNGTAWVTSIYNQQPWVLKPQMVIWSPETETLFYLDEDMTLVEADNTADV